MNTTSKMDLYTNLIIAIRNSGADPMDIEDDIETARDKVLSFPAYFNAVIECVVQANTLSKENISHYQYTIMKNDQRRRDKHIAAALAVNVLNRLCKIYKVEEMFPIGELNPDSVQDREAAINAVYLFCKETFLDEAYRSGYPVKDITVQEMDKELMEMAKDQEEREMRSSYNGQKMFNTDIDI